METKQYENCTKSIYYFNCKEDVTYIYFFTNPAEIIVEEGEKEAFFSDPNINLTDNIIHDFFKDKIIGPTMLVVGKDVNDKTYSLCFSGLSEQVKESIMYFNEEGKSNE